MRFRTVIFVIIMISIILNCQKDKPTGLYDSGKESNPDPVIESMSPPNSALAGIVDIVINGSHFSPVPENNVVYFGKTKALVHSATENQLVVKSPNIFQDSLEVKVAVIGAMLFSNSMYYSLIRPIEEIGDFGEYDEPYVIACDADENIYVAMRKPKRIDKITPDGIRQPYAEISFSTPTGMKMGPNGVLYIGRKSRYLYEVQPGATEAERSFKAPGTVYDLDFSENGMIYAGGDDDALFLINPEDGSSDEVAEYEDTEITAIRVFDGFVYVGGKETVTNKLCIWRNRILSDNSVEEKELYFDWGQKIAPDSLILSFTFSADGDLYVGTEKSEAIIIIHPDGSHEPLYPGLLQPVANYLCWGNAEYLYVCQHKTQYTDDGDRLYIKDIAKINMLKSGALYFGR